MLHNDSHKFESGFISVVIPQNNSVMFGPLSGSKLGIWIAHGEGKFLANDDCIAQLAQNGQIATQYVDLNGNPTSDIRFNPNDSVFAIEGITSPDGRVFGKMGHSERIGNGLYQNVPGDFEIGMFRSAVSYFKN